MKITIIAVGRNMPGWVCDGYKEYANRMPPDYQVDLIEITPEKRSKNANLSKIALTEEAKITAAIPKGSYCISLDRVGKPCDTKTLSKRLQTWHDNQQPACLIIGGPEGLSTDFLKKSNEIWSISTMTFPHPLVRVILIEQIYRAWSITINHPYHR